MQLHIDQARNQLRIGVDTEPVTGRLRWEAAVLALLIQGGHEDAASACGMARLQARLAQLGQKTALNRKQLSRLWDSLAELFEAAGQATAFAARFGHAPRARTVGPWWWARLPSDELHCVLSHPALDEQQLYATALPGLAAQADVAATAALCRQFLLFHGQVADGNHAAAVETLTDATAWQGASQELDALRLLRLNDSYRTLRDFPRGRAAMRAAQALLAEHSLARSYLAGTALVLEQRMSYSEAPTTNYAAIGAVLRPFVGQAAGQAHLEVDCFVRGNALNLAALCERRWIEEHARREAPELWQPHWQAALRYWCAALFSYLVSCQFEYVQYACANLAYFLQRCYVLGLSAEPDGALAWYGLAQAWQNRFDLADNTVWEYVFLGDFWLYHPQARQAFAKLDVRAEWEGRRPDSLDFYVYAERRAREIGDPRQTAHAALNLYHFVRQRGLGELIEPSRSALSRVLRAHPDVLEILLAEGYPLPNLRGTATTELLQAG
ncbi:hypothetical protein [Paucibacter soli]|uniref:hypothetical protein n=1 Tax=Paucibacter soli TaxID=3133433 RepID=UPI0030B33F07